MNTRRIALTLVIMTLTLVFTEGSARAETGTALQQDVQFQLRRANGLRINGIVHSSLGMATFATGMGFIIAGIVEDANYDPEAPTMGGFFSYMAGGIILTASAVLLAVGIPLWVVGARRRARLMGSLARMPVVSVAADPARSTYGLSLAWAF